MTIRIAVRGRHRATGRSILNNARALGVQGLAGCEVSRIYFLAQTPGTESLARLCASLLADPVMETASWIDLEKQEAAAAPGCHVVEVSLRPGVTDVTARELARGMVEMGLPACEVATATRYELDGTLGQGEVHRLIRQLLCNETIEYYRLGVIAPHFSRATAPSDHVEQIALADLDDEALQALSRERLLSLDRAEMRAIQSFYRTGRRSPTDVELETLAQTWSEHCVHKTFRAQIDFTWQDADGHVRRQELIDGLLRQYIRAATEAVQPPWLHSAFVDNAGIIAFDEGWDLAFKVETHNHPSALEPFGGANTGVGGVVRDIIGVSARPVATTDVLCFGPQDYPVEVLPNGVLHPRRIADGVVAGVGDYGNKLGLPTVNGAVIYHEGYLGNPLVYCGCVGLLPAGSHPTQPQEGDLVVVLGGRTGRDGLHGATFSSAELTHETSETSGSAVQIGDPITEKGLIELVEAARDERLYTAITDCGAGGLSSAVGEMGSELGVEVELTQVLLKYPGLTPWEIWLSEAQERMVVAVPAESLARLQALAALWEVETSVLGHFTGDGQLLVRYDGRIVAALPMGFLHEGLPRRRMQAVWRERPAVAESPPQPADLNAILLLLLADPSVASKEEIVRTYDYEVRGGTLVRPLVGPCMDGPGDAAVLKPLGSWHHQRAFALSAGLNPVLGQHDPYAMAIGAIDEAFRNAVAVGADPDQIALLDNFCWGNPTYPDRLGSLVRACQGCYDGALAYRAPFISGKDSLYNEFNGQPIPGTLLISAIGIVPDMHHCVTADLKRPGNLLYLLGDTRAELGGSLFYAHLGYEGGQAPVMPEEPLARYRALHQVMRQGLVRACHDLSEGGLAVALAEMAVAGRLGAAVALPSVGLAAADFLFSESNGRLILEVDPNHAQELEAVLTGKPLLKLGSVTAQQDLTVTIGDEAIITLPVARLVQAWKREG